MSEVPLYDITRGGAGASTGLTCEAAQATPDSEKNESRV